ncbi:MAG: amidohydrolase family protein [Thermoplasmata archaeon]
MKLEGLAYNLDDIVPVSIEINKGNVKKIKKISTTNSKKIFLPPFVNSHIHIGDAGILLEPAMDVKSTVAPPDGLKYKGYKEIPIKDRMKNAHYYIKEMVREGILRFVDFREEGIFGIESLLKLSKSIKNYSTILGRPNQMTYDKNELDNVLNYSDGLGLSGMAEWDFNELNKIRKHTKERKKLFGIHVSEDKREDISKIVSLMPDFIVHMTLSTEEDIKKIALNNIPIIVCPRSNLIFGNIPPVDVMLKHNVQVMIGTDNSFLNYPSIFREMEIAYKLFHRKGVTAKSILKMATISSYKTFDFPWKLDVEEMNSFLVYKVSKYDLKNLDYSIVNFGNSRKIEMSFLRGSRVSIDSI